MTCNVNGRLSEIDLAAALPTGLHVEYTADGDRITRTENGTTTVYLPGGQEVAVSSSGTKATRYYSFAGQPVAMRTGPSTAELWTTIADPHQTVSIAINNNAKPSEGVIKRRMDPWGNPRGTNPTWPTDRGHLNKPTDATGLTSVGARYYDPAFGSGRGHWRARRGRRDREPRWTCG